MAYPPNGQGYYGQYTDFHGSSDHSSRYDGYASPPPNPHPFVRRTPSFDAGDDRTYYNNTVTGQQSHPGSATYRTGTRNTNIQQAEQHTGTSSPVSSNHPNVSTGAGSFYYPETPPLPSSSSTPSAYNPQEYAARSSAQYNPQLYRTQNIAQSPSYQPYIPAAYQAPAVPQQSPKIFQTSEFVRPYGHNPSYQQAVGSPVLPQSYSQPGRRLSHSSGQQYSNQLTDYSYRSAPLPPLPDASNISQRPIAYTPPAPPPPPFSPARDAFPPNAGAPGRSVAHNVATNPAPPASLSNNRSFNALHRLPSLPQFQGSGNYLTSTAVSRQSASPHLSPEVSLPSSPGPTPPQHSPQRTDSTRHPERRLPGPPITSYAEAEYFDARNGNRYDDDGEVIYGYDDIMKEVEAAVMGRASSVNSSRHSPRTERINYPIPINEEEETPALFSGTPTTSIAPDTEHTHTNHRGPGGIGTDANYSAYSDESDAEAAGGLAAIRMAEQQDAVDEARRHSGVTTVPSVYGSQGDSGQNLGNAEGSSDSDVPVDMETYGGTFPSDLNYRYGTDVSSISNTESTNNHYLNPPNASSHWSSQQSEVLEMPEDDYFISDEEAIHPFPSFGARVDTGGTGGFSEPGAYVRRLSFEDGDEAALVDLDYGPTSGVLSPARDLMLNSYPGRTSRRGRPLPQVPGISTTNPSQLRRPVDQFGQPMYPLAPDAYEQNYTSSGTPVQKANSIGSHSTTPLVIPPGRSITDAEQRRRQHHGIAMRSSSGYDHLGTAASNSANAKFSDLDLPTIPAGRRRKFIPTKLSGNDFRRCAEPWALSSIVSWIKEMTDGEADLKEGAISEAIVLLFTHKVPTMNTADAEVLSAQIMTAMFDEGALLKEEEWVKLGSNPMSGVLYQLTGTGCYSSRVHSVSTSGRCYSHHCMRTLKKIDLQTQALEPQRKVEDWSTFYKVREEDKRDVPKKEIMRQNNLHEIVTSEDYFMDQLNVLQLLYRNGLAQSPDPIISPKKLDGFLRDVFGKVDKVKQVNEDYLLAQLKYRQNEDGPWIKGFADIFREWIRKAKVAYTEYAANFPNAILLVRTEAHRNVLFRQFLDQMRDSPQSRRLGHDTYLRAPIVRLQRYGLLLKEVLKNTEDNGLERKELQTAIEEIRVVTLDCDARVAEMSKQVDLADLAGKLKLRPGMEKVQLNLTHLGREKIYEGDLQRKGNNKVSWLETHAILFDHYLVLSKPVQQRDAAGGLKQELYDVSKLPIPMGLLVLESVNDDPVVRSSVKGIASVSTVTTRAQTPQEARLGRTISNQNGGSGGPGTLSHSNTGTSVQSNGITTSGAKSATNVTVLDSPSEKVMYPFRVKHLGKIDGYVLYAPTSQNRQEWVDKIIEAKTRHAASLFAQNAEPFRLRVMADTAFSYDSNSGYPKGTTIAGTPLDRAIKEVERTHDGTSHRLAPVCRAQVNCATAFMQPYGQQKVAVGTDYGVYITDYNNPRGWVRAIAAQRITQIAVLDDFSLFLVLADKVLIAYHLDVVCPVHGAPTLASETSTRRAPQKLSGSRDVGFFATGRMKDRTLVFYKKREGISSTFKVLEPVYQKSSTSSRNRFGMRKGTTEFFRDFDDFYIPSETYAINLFHSSLAIATTRGIEVLTLDKKVPFSIPDVKAPEVASIAARIRDQKPLGMFRLSDNEFLLVFDEVGIYVDKHGDVSRAVVMDFVGKARQAALYNNTYLVLVDIGSAYVEVRNAINGRLRQVVSGRDVRLLDDGVNGSTIKICMQHPELERSQVVMEMIVNEGLKE